jgi:hypothetical protein
LRIERQKVVVASEQTYGSDHLEVAAVLVGWAQRLMRDGERDPAIPLLARALTIRPRALADADGTLLWLLRSVDEALSEAGEYDAVRDLYLHAYNACAPALGDTHPRVSDLQVRLRSLPDASPTSADGGAAVWRPDAVPNDEASGGMAEADVVLFQSPARRSAMETLRTILRDGADLAAAKAPTLAAAIASPAEVLVLVLPDDRAVRLSSEQITRLQQRKVIGVGYGAARLFGQLGLEINAGACAHYGVSSMRLSLEPNQLVPLPEAGDSTGIAHGDAPGPVDHVGLHIPKTSHLMRVVDVIARETSDPNYALIARQGGHILIGVVSPADAWTPAYAALFAAIARALHAAAAQPFARAAWETVRPGTYSLSLAHGRSTTKASQYEGYLRFSKPTPFSATLTIATSDNVMLLFMGERREHWAREDGEDGETLTISVDITAEDLQAVGDRYWHLRVVNFDTAHPATCELTLTYND